MVEIIDTSAAFDEFARGAALESPVFREKLWREGYEGAHADLFEGYYATQTSRSRPTRMVRELAALRRRVADFAPVLRRVIEETDPVVRDLLGAAAAPAPVHVLLVGNGATNAIVGRVEGRVAVYHCLEWAQAAAPARVLTAHEVAHAWHQLVLGIDPAADADPAWAVFVEGLAIQASRAAAPERPEHEYFWYGLAGFEGWPAWCRKHRGLLRERLRAGLEGEGAAGEMFTGGADGEPSRTGYFVADDVVGELRRELADLARLNPADARLAVRANLEVPG